jgi:NAD-dependent dihydropyrimidine dehydrogenase PreA subunit
VGLVGRRIVRALEERGLRALDPSLGFPMEMDRYPGRTWVIAHKTVAVAAGLGAMGIHRNVIHPRFGSFILLGTVVVAAEAKEKSRPLDFNPCVACKLCVAACPVGAISAGGRFDFSACVTHNYREFMGGFTDWVRERGRGGQRRRLQEARPGLRERLHVAEPRLRPQLQGRLLPSAVCPAGEDVITPFRDDRAEFLARVVRPLQAREEPVYVMAGTDAEQHVARRFPHKTVRRVGKVLRPTTVAGFLRSLPLAFQPGRAGDLRALVHFRFTGREAREATVRIEGGALTVDAGLAGRPDVTVTADSTAWLRFARGELGLLSALLTLRIRLHGSPRIFVRFGRCFPR